MAGVLLADIRPAEHACQVGSGERPAGVSPLEKYFRQSLKMRIFWYRIKSSRPWRSGAGFCVREATA